jgi:UDP-N-acetylmuramoyl-L-alanyl-D-glutamate--2,6-diaminopimelate ligase
MLISELLKGVSYKGETELDFDGITADSERISGACPLFFAYKGSSFDSHNLAAELYRSGKIAYIASERIIEGIPSVLVEDGRRAFCKASAAFFRNPQEELTLIGVTGTNGKTTVTYLIEKIFEEKGVARIGTNGISLVGEELPANTTTPSPYDFFACLRRAADKGAEIAVTEVSSHALSQGRLSGVIFDAAVFTNLTGDHLDYHGDMDSYFNAKKLLFADAYSVKRIINVHNLYGEVLFEETGGEKYSYGSYNPVACDLSVADAEFSFDGIKAVLSYRGEDFELKTPLLGGHNLENIMAALCAAIALGVPAPEAAKRAGELGRIPGRLERYDNGGITVFIDYAHTDDALKRITQTLGRLKNGRLITVFGAGGDRDRSKRPRMGRAVGENSDIAVVTSDNPRTETPASIIDDILEGLSDRRKVYVQEDRERAIEFALSIAEKNDVLLVAGKGHEDYQIVGKTKRHFSDSETVKKYLYGRRI